MGGTAAAAESPRLLGPSGQPCEGSDKASGLPDCTGHPHLRLERPPTPWLRSWKKFLVEKPKKKLEKTPPRYRFTPSPYISLPTDFLANHSSQAGIIWNHLLLPSPCLLLFSGTLGLRSAGDQGVHVHVVAQAVLRSCLSSWQPFRKENFLFISASSPQTASGFLGVPSDHRQLLGSSSAIAQILLPAAMRTNSV